MAAAGPRRDPGGRARLRVARRRPRARDAFAHAFEEGDGLREPNRVGVSSHLAGSGKQFCAAAREWSGVSLAMRAGWRCWFEFEDLRREGELLTGRLVGGEVARPVGVDEGTPALVAWPEGDETAAVTSPGELLPGGIVRIVIAGETMWRTGRGEPVVGRVIRPATHRWSQAVSEEIRLS